MGELRDKHTIFGPFPDRDPIDTALLFLRTNRYQIEAEERGEAPAELTVDSVSAPTDADPSTPAESADEARHDETASGPERDAESPESGSGGEHPATEEDETPPDEEGAVSAADADPAEVEPPEPGPRDEPVSAAGDAPADVLLRAVVKRGKSGSGYFTSNMSELPTTLTLQLERNSLRLEYVVDTSGQFLREEEREFWRKEARALEAFVRGEGGMLDIADEERTRAQAARGDLLTMGLWAAGIVFVLIFIAGVILFRV